MTENGQRNLVAIWFSPNPSFYKCNVDASFFNEQGKTGFGMCTRDHLGQFIIARTDWAPFCLPTLEGETIGLLTVWASIMLYLKLTVKLLRITYKVPELVFLNLDLLFLLALISFFLFQSFRISFVRRQAKSVAHSLAKASLSSANPHDYHFVSSCIAALIINEMQ